MEFATETTAEGATRLRLGEILVRSATPTREELDTHPRQQSAAKVGAGGTAKLSRTTG